jgi:predicted metal-dependent hydrolase
MNTEKTVLVEPVGEVKLIKNKRSRHIRLRVNPKGEAQLTMPVSASEKNAIQFIKSKSDWIQKQQKKIRAGLTIFTPDTQFRTKFHELRIVITEQNKLSNHIGNGILQINVPSKFDIQQPEVQQFIKNLIIKLMTHEAKIYLPKRIQELANKHGFTFQKVFVKHVKTRWGSCSAVNNINLNIHLMRLPDQLIDYVILHELVHTKVKNHSKIFWDLLEKIYPGAKSFNKELRNYQVGLF